MEIGRLTPINARDAWLHEAHDFTPWLAEHLDELGEVLGIQMELQGREVAVETFSADILARNLFDDSLILIENQLETTDHRHLGQILTYLAGLEAKTVIWLATDFREPHLSAVKWLNEHTADAFSFFAVRLRVVRIGDSAAAPIFDVLARPNLWERQLQAVARKSENMSEVGEHRRGFWEAYLERYPGDAALGLAATGGNRNWVPVAENDQVIISAWVGRAVLGLFVRGAPGGDGNELAEIIEPHRSALEAQLGANYNRKSANSFYGKQLKVDMQDRANWPAAIDWLHEQIQQYLAVLRSTLQVSSG